MGILEVVRCSFGRGVRGGAIRDGDFYRLFFFSLPTCRYCYLAPLGGGAACLGLFRCNYYLAWGALSVQECRQRCQKGRLFSGSRPSLNAQHVLGLATSRDEQALPVGSDELIAA